MFSLIFSPTVCTLTSYFKVTWHWTIKLSSAKSLSGQYYQVCGLRYYLRVLTTFWDILSLACITGALWAKGGERGILREVQNECEAQDKGRRKNKETKKNFPPRLTLRTRFCLRLTWIIKPVMEAIRSQSCALSSLSSRNLQVIGHWPLGRVNFVFLKSRCFLWLCLMKHWDISPDHRGTQREYSSKPLKHSLLNVF